MLAINLLRRRLPLTRGKVAFVDALDPKEPWRFKWRAQRDGNTFYAARNVRLGKGRWTVQTLHKFLTEAPQTDHQDCDGLNNQRYNLRPCTSQQNNANRRKSKGCSSDFKGVYWDKRDSRWCSQIGVNGKTIRLGRFADEVEAANAYNESAILHYGEFARLNQLPT